MRMELGGSQLHTSMALPAWVGCFLVTKKKNHRHSHEVQIKPKSLNTIKHYKIQTQREGGRYKNLDTAEQRSDQLCFVPLKRHLAETALFAAP